MTAPARISPPQNVTGPNDSFSRSNISVYPADIHTFQPKAFYPPTATLTPAIPAPFPSLNNQQPGSLPSATIAVPSCATTPTARSLYVASNGNDENPGTQNLPFASIEKADSVATPGTTVHVAPGTYTWTGQATFTSGTANARIIFISDIRWGAKLAPPYVDNAHTANSIWDSGGNYVDIIGFDLDGQGTIERGIANNGAYSRVIGNKVHDLLGVGINITNYTRGGQDNDTIGNLVYNIGDGPANNLVHGIYQANYGGHIVNNIVWNASGYGIHCWHACSSVTIANNFVFQNGSGGILWGAGDAPGEIMTDSMIVSNNIALDNGKFGLREYEYPGSHTIGSHNQILNNLVFGNPTAISLLEDNIDQGTIQVDPHIMNYQANGLGDYHLQFGSPAIDTGTPIGAPTTDFDCTSRPQGKGYDIGPYEYH